MLYLLVGIALFLIVVAPQVLIAINLLLVVVRPQEFMLPPGSGGVVMLMLGAAAVAWIIGKRKDLSYPQLTLLTGFFIVLPLSEIFSGNGGDASTALTEFFPAWLLFVVISSSVETLEQIRRYMYLLVVFATLVAIHSIQQYFHDTAWAGADILIENGVRRVRYLGIFHDPNDLAIFFISALPMAWYGARRFRESPLQYLFHAASVVIVYALYLTKSRGGMLSLGVILLLMLWRHFDFVKAAVVTGILAVIGAGLQLRKESIGGGDQSSLDRIDGWALGMELFQSHPLFGVGYNHFMDYYFLTAHNSFVLVLSETGIVGYVLWVSFFIALMALLLRTSLNGDGLKIMEAEPWDELNEWQQICWIFFLSLAGYLFGSFFLSQTYTIYLFLLAAFATAAWALAYRHDHPEMEDLSAAWSIVPMSMAAAAASIVVLWLLIRLLVVISY